MSKKPVNFYQGAKGTFKDEIIGSTSGEVTVYKATHTYEEIKQAIADGFVPYCVIKEGETGVGYYYLIYDNTTLEQTRLTFDGNTEQVVIKVNNEVTIEDKESGGSGGESGGTGVFLVTFVDGDTVTCDKTLQEINAAYTEGNIIIARFVYIEDGESFPINPPMGCSELSSNMACFYCMYSNNGDFRARTIEYYPVGISIYDKSMSTGE